MPRSRVRRNYCRRLKIRDRVTTANRLSHRLPATSTSWCRCATASKSASTSIGRRQAENFPPCWRLPSTTRTFRVPTWRQRCRRSRPGRRCGPARWRRATPSFSSHVAMFTSSARRAASANRRAAAPANGTATISSNGSRRRTGATAMSEWWASPASAPSSLRSPRSSRRILKRSSRSIPAALMANSAASATNIPAASFICSVIWSAISRRCISTRARPAC